MRANIPSNLQGSIVINGGSADLVFTAGETKIVNLQVKNTGKLAHDATAAFTFSVVNLGAGGPVTKTFQLTFIHGLCSSATLTIKAIDGTTQQIIPGALIQCAYGVNNEDGKTGSTSNNDGSITFDLGTYTGQVQVTASAPGRFRNQTQIVTVNEGANTETFYMTPELGTVTTPQNNQTNGALYGAIVIAIAAIFVGALAGYSVMKKKNKPPTSLEASKT